MAKTKTKPAPLTALDEDLAAASMDRHEAWRRLMIKDSVANREAYADACNEVDDLLDARLHIMTAERIVAG